MNLEAFYNKNYRKLLVIPVVLLLFSIVYLVIFSFQQGDIFRKDVSLQGGVSATFYVNKLLDINDIRSLLSKELRDSDVIVRSLVGIERARSGFIIEASNIDVDTLKQLLENNFDIILNDENFFVEETGSRLGEGFYKDMVRALIIAFVLMGIVVFITYRSIVPSFAVIASAFMDIVVTIAVIDILGIRISSAGFAALILLTGYSVDTDILLTTRVLRRREGTIWDRIKSSMATGLTMSATTVGAMIVGYIFSTSAVFKQMFIIITIGIFVDVIATYLMNAGILKIYMMKKYHEN